MTGRPTRDQSICRICFQGEHQTIIPKVSGVSRGICLRCRRINDRNRYFLNRKHKQPHHPAVEHNATVLMDLKPGAYRLLFRMTEKPNNDAFLVLGESSAYLNTGQGREFAIRLEIRFLARFAAEQYLLITPEPFEPKSTDGTLTDPSIYLQNPPTGKEDYRRVDQPQPSSSYNRWQQYYHRSRDLEEDT